MHDLDYIPLYERIISSETFNINTGWKLFLAFLIPIIIILVFGSLTWSLFVKQKKSVVFSLFGGNHFFVEIADIGNFIVAGAHENTQVRFKIRE